MRTRRDFAVGMVAASLAVAATLGTVALIQPVQGEKERTMNPDDPVDTDLVTLPSAHGATETVERLKALLAQKGIELFAHDFAQLARPHLLVSRDMRLQQVNVDGDRDPRLAVDPAFLVAIDSGKPNQQAMRPAQRELHGTNLL